MVKRPGSPARSPFAGTRFVLDCSIVLAWFFADEADSYADDIAACLARSQAVVPSLWPLEVANALVMGERRRRNSPDQSSTFLARLASLPIQVDDLTSSMAWAGALPLARNHRLSAYDAAYLELALREGLPLATLDSELSEAAQRLEVARHRP